jgi:hypothetical protein
MEEWTPLRAMLQPLVDELITDGARAVVLVGSHARGDAGAHVDVDVTAVGEGGEYRLERRGNYLVSLSWRTAERIRASFDDPAQAGAAVPGWRSAVILDDRDGIAASLTKEAREWRWSRIEAARGPWIAEEFTGYAEEVQKLLGALVSGERTNAAVQRSLLALRMARIVAVHACLLYDTENRLWDLVAEQMGESWTDNQAAAFGLRGQPFEETCAAALRLYALAADLVWPLLDQRQRAVAEHAVALIRERP